MQYMHSLFSIDEDTVLNLLSNRDDIKYKKNTCLRKNLEFKSILSGSIAKKLSKKQDDKIKIEGEKIQSLMSKYLTDYVLKQHRKQAFTLKDGGRIRYEFSFKREFRACRKETRFEEGKQDRPCKGIDRSNFGSEDRGTVQFVEKRNRGKKRGLNTFSTISI